jgi:hypothetical protein
MARLNILDETVTPDEQQMQDALSRAEDAQRAARIAERRLPKVKVCTLRRVNGALVLQFPHKISDAMQMILLEDGWRKQGKEWQGRDLKSGLALIKLTNGDNQL